MSLSERIHIIFTKLHLNAFVLRINSIVSGTGKNLEQKDVYLEVASAPMKSRIANKKEVAPKPMMVATSSLRMMPHRPSMPVIILSAMWRRLHHRAFLDFGRAVYATNSISHD